MSTYSLNIKIYAAPFVAIAASQPRTVLFGAGGGTRYAILNVTWKGNSASTYPTVDIDGLVIYPDASPLPAANFVATKTIYLGPGQSIYGTTGVGEAVSVTGVEFANTM